MAQADQAGVAPAAQPRRWPGLLLLIVALIEFLGGLGSLPILAGDLNEMPGPGLGGQIIIATIILRPIAAAAALFFLVRGNLAWRLIAMAVVILVELVQLPAVDPAARPRTGGDLEVTRQRHGDGGPVVFACSSLPPMLVLAIAGLALTGKQLTLATLLAVLPTLIGILGVVAFGIGVAIYGF